MDILILNVGVVLYNNAADVPCIIKLIFLLNLRYLESSHYSFNFVDLGVKLETIYHKLADISSVKETRMTEEAEWLKAKSRRNIGKNENRYYLIFC